MGFDAEDAVKKDAVELDHISVPVRRYREARKFYEAALGAIGMTVNMEFEDACGMGSNGEKIFWLVRDRRASGGGHYAVRVARREMVQAFYDAAIAAGGIDHGPPGPRPGYGPTYYAAFVKDGERNNIEVVCYAKPRRGAPLKRPAGTRLRPRRRPA
jgi:catechol 2,3-dioxygenase-like lactoylglutathione lyase family enzyme